MRILFVFGFLLMAVSGCRGPSWFTLFSPPSFPVLRENVDCAQATSVIQDYSTELRYDRHLHLRRAKTFCNGGVTTIQLEYISQDILDVCEARMLIVDVVEGYLARINQNPGLAMELASFPFTAANLEIYITFESYFGRYVDPFYVHWVALDNNVVSIFAFDLYDDTKMSWHTRRESYETSREIVVYQKQAEDKYHQLHKPNMSIFGNQRYFPPGTK